MRIVCSIGLQNTRLPVGFSKAELTDSIVFSRMREIAEEGLTNPLLPLVVFIAPIKHISSSISIH